MLPYVHVHYKVRLASPLIKRREVMDRAKRIRSKKLRDYHYTEGYTRSLESKILERDNESNAEHVWE